MKTYNKKRGFTLVELIVVIAIVAILAAVSIVGYQGYINKARVSNDVTDAKNMDSILQNYAIINSLDLNDLTSQDVKTIVNIDNNYSFIPRSSGNSFWFSPDLGIYLASSYEQMASELNGPFQNTFLLNDPSLYSRDLEELFQDTFLLDSGGESNVSRVLNTIRNLKTADEFDQALLTVDALAYPDLVDLLETFNPNETLYIRDFDSVTRGTQIKRIVFSSGIDSLPTGAFRFEGSYLPEHELVFVDSDGNPLSQLELRLPLSISMIEDRALLGITNVRVTTLRTIDIRVEHGAFDPSDTLNTALKQLEGTGQLLNINITLDVHNLVTNYYNPIFVGDEKITEPLGKRVNIRISEISTLYEGYHRIARLPNGSCPAGYDNHASGFCYDQAFFLLRAIDDGSTISSDYYLSNSSGDVLGEPLIAAEGFDIGWPGNFSFVEFPVQKTIFEYYDGTHYTPYPTSFQDWLTRMAGATTKLPNKDAYVEIITPDSTTFFNYDLENNTQGAQVSDETNYLDINLVELFHSSSNYLRVSSFQRSIVVTLKDEETNVEIGSLNSSYRMHRGLTLIEVKVYDSSGMFIAKGTLEYIREYYN